MELLQHLPALCDGLVESSWLFFSSNVPPFIYYTHVPAAFLALLAGVIIFVFDPKKRQNVIFLLSLLPFSIWVIFNIIIWATNRSDVIMFLWSIQILIEPLTYVLMLYLVFLFLKGKDVSMGYKWLAFFVYLPLIIISPTIFSLSGFDISYCIPTEEIYSYYTYVLELVSILVIVGLTIHHIYVLKDKDEKKKVAYFVFGIVLFLLLFASGNIFGSMTDDWVQSQAGLLGTPIFVFFLGLVMSKYQIFNGKIIGAVSIVFAVWMLVFSLVFLRQISSVRLIVAITLFFLTLFGYFLIKGIRREIQQKEYLAQLSSSLEDANEKLQQLDKMKNEFLSIASHQLRTPLSIIKGYISLIEDGAYGKMPVKVEPILKNIEDSNERLVKLVDDFLDVSRLEQGRTKYSFGPVDIVAMMDSVVTEFGNKANEKNIKLQVEKDETVPHQIIADEERVRHGMFNYLDNAIKYSPENTNIIVRLKRDSNKIIYSVTDQGVGMDQDDIKNLFQKFYRSPKILQEYQGTGLGLFVVKEFIEAHGGEVSATSPGIGKGSTFTLWIPTEPSGNIYTDWLREHNG